MVHAFNELESFLYSLKLSPDEAKTYLALVKHGPQTFQGVNRLAEVPQDKIVAILRTLNRTGWIETRKESPEVFYAIYPREPLLEYFSDTKRWIIWD